MTTNELIANLHKARAALLDPLDLPRTWTQRQVDDYEKRRATIDAVSRGLQNTVAVLGKPSERLARLTPARDRLRAAEAAIQQQITDAPEWRAIGDPRARDHEWGRQQELTASLTALRDGVGYMNGDPALPGPLRTLLTEACPTCAHVTLDWPGSISSLDEEIARDQKIVAEENARLLGYVQQAEELLAEPVMS